MTYDTAESLRQFIVNLLYGIPVAALLAAALYVWRSRAGRE